MKSDLPRRKKSMKKKDQSTAIRIAFEILLITCLTSGCNLREKNAVDKGVHQAMKTYYIGRFSVAVPAGVEETKGSRLHQLRDIEVSEICWPIGTSPERAREAEWEKFIDMVKTITPPHNKERAIISIRDFPEIGKWAKGVFYYNDLENNRTAPWSLLMDTGSVGVWLNTDPPVVIEKEMKSNNAANNLTIIGKSYHFMSPKDLKPNGDWFYLEHGAINLPYRWQENSEIRFSGNSPRLIIRIKMDMDIAQEREPHGLIEKTTAAIDSGYAVSANIQMMRIRSQKRVVAGMTGEEEVDRLRDKDKTTLDFGWEYVGKENSGEYPTTRITMESPDGNLSEKLQIWDAILDSMKPMFERKK
jgi:hypothetical protein